LASTYLVEKNNADKLEEQLKNIKAKKVEIEGKKQDVCFLSY